MGKNKNSAKSLDTDSTERVIGYICVGEECLIITGNDVDCTNWSKWIRGLVHRVRRRKSAAKVVREGRAAIRCGLVTGGRA